MSTADASLAMASLRRELEHELHDDDGATRDVAVRLVCWMLGATRPWPAAARDTLEGLFAAHRDGASDAATWRRLRKAAVALGDSADPDVRRFGKVAEAAAWPLASSASGLPELLRPISALRGAQAAARTGWTHEDEARAHAELTVIARGDGTTPAPRETIPGLFQAANPELARRFATQLDASNAAFAGFRREVAAWIVGAGD